MSIEGSLAVCKFDYSCILPPFPASRTFFLREDNPVAQEAATSCGPISLRVASFPLSKPTEVNATLPLDVVAPDTGLFLTASRLVNLFFAPPISLRAHISSCRADDFSVLSALCRQFFLPARTPFELRVSFSESGLESRACFHNLASLEMASGHLKWKAHMAFDRCIFLPTIHYPFRFKILEPRGPPKSSFEADRACEDLTAVTLPATSDLPPYPLPQFV